MRIYMQSVSHAALLFCSAVLVVVMNAGCTSKSGSYQDTNTYSKALYSEVVRKSFEYEGPGRNPVIVIHGFLGAQLVDSASGDNIWGNFSFNEMLSGKKFAKLAYPMVYDMPLNKIKSSVRPAGLLEKAEVRIFGFNFEYENYDLLVRTLSEAGYVPDNRPMPPDKNFYTQFVFYYDWRREISENAVELEQFISEKRAYIQRRYRELYGLENYDVQFDVIGHSMGGLLARYYLLYGGTLLPDDENEKLRVTWKGSKHVDKVIIVGTPNAGYVDTLIEMTNGLQLASGAPVIPPAVVGTFVSCYQMLPTMEGHNVVWDGTKEPVDYLSAKTWIELNWGLADRDQDSWLRQMLPYAATPEERRKIALDHLEKCLKRARQFKKAMYVFTHQPDDVGFFLIAGDAVETNNVVSVNRKTGELTVIKKEAGDGKVTSVSARFDLRDSERWLPFMISPINWTGVYYLQGGHMGIMNGDSFASNLSYILMAWPTDKQKKQLPHFLKVITTGNEHNDYEQ